MTISEHWTEVLSCPLCKLAGVCHLSQLGTGEVVVKSLPIGFKAVAWQYGDTFYCIACNHPARADTK
jgi:hypothetical protein